jgi:hypothetical protein
MKLRLLLLVLGLIATPLAFTTSVVAAPKEVKTDEDSVPEEKEGKKNTTILTLSAPAEKVHATALEALAGIGCKIKKDSATHIEAKRPNKVGLAVGSGGEKLLVWIKDLGDGKTELKVTTKKTLAGIIGQKLWNEEVANQIRDAIK